MVGTGRYDWVTSYDLVVGTIVDMDEAIYMISPADSPMLTGMGADGLSVLSSKPATQRRVDWLSDALLTPRSIAAAILIGATTVTLSVSGDGAKFGVGDVILLADPAANEHMLITGISGDVLTVTRGAPYGTAAAHATAANNIVIGVGQALPEGSNPPQSRVTERVPSYNVTQIFGPEQVAMSATEQVIQKYGVPSEMSHQLFQRTQELAIRREQAILYGRRIEDDSATRRTMGGIFSMITSNSSAATALDITALQAQQQRCYEAGGQPDRLMVNPVALADLNDTSNTTRIRQDFADTRRGRQPVSEVMTEFGPVSIVRNRWLKKSDAALFRRDQVVRRPLRPLILEKLAKTGDRDSMQMVCEESLEVKGQEHMAEFTQLAYT